jgi:hypothetical protein
MLAQKDHIIVQFSLLGADFLPGQTSPVAIISPLTALRLKQHRLNFFRQTANLDGMGFSIISRIAGNGFYA